MKNKIVYLAIGTFLVLCGFKNVSAQTSKIYLHPGDTWISQHELVKVHEVREEDDAVGYVFDDPSNGKGTCDHVIVIGHYTGTSTTTGEIRCTRNHQEECYESGTCDDDPTIIVID